MYKLVIATIALIVNNLTGFSQEGLTDKDINSTVNKMKVKDEKDTSYWKKGGVFGINGSQVSLTNWAGGGQSSVSAAALLSLFSNYKKDKLHWDSTLDFGFGVIQQKKVVFKSDDKIDLSSILGYKAFKNWYYSGLTTFRSQFAAGFNAPGDTIRISNFLAPAYSIVSVGLEYKPNKEFNLFLSPLTSKITLVNDQRLANAGAFGVQAAEFDDLGNLVRRGRRSRFEVGGFVKLAYTKKIMENIVLTTRADFFSNYLKEPQNIDINWETMIVMKVNKFISVNLTTHLIYDHDIIIGVDTNGDGTADRFGPRTQFKQVLAVGFNYKF